MVWGGGGCEVAGPRPRPQRRGGVGTDDCMDMARMVGTFDTLGQFKLMIFFNFIFRAKPG